MFTGEEETTMIDRDIIFHVEQLVHFAPTSELSEGLPASPQGCGKPCPRGVK
jgi:hypothetical protein